MMTGTTGFFSFARMRIAAILGLALLQVACASGQHPSIGERVQVTVKPVTSRVYVVHAMSVDAAVVGIETVGGSVIHGLDAGPAVAARLTHGQVEALEGNVRILGIEDAADQALSSARVVAIAER